MSKFSAWRMISKYFHMIVALAQELSKQGTELKIFGNTFWFDFMISTKFKTQK